MKKTKFKNLLWKTLSFLILSSIPLILWNCNDDNSETITFIEENYYSEPLIETVTFKQVENEKAFTELDEIYDLNLNPKNIKYARKLVDTMGITIETSSIKKITYNNYVSYTMLMVEPKDESNNFSNIVIQESNGIKSIFTVRYFTNNTTAKKDNIKAKDAISSSLSFSMMSGINSNTEPWGDPDGGGGGSGGGCDEYVEVCNTLLVWVPQGCSCKGHMPGQFCTCAKEGGQGPYHAVQEKVECENVCVVAGNPNDSGSNNTGTTGGSGGGTSGSGTSSNTTPSTVLTSPMNPDGTPVDIHNASQINEELSLISPYNVDMRQVLDSIYLPKKDSIKIANERLLCVYEKLTTSNTFKNLFTNIFGGTQDKLNVEFKVTKNLMHNDTVKANGKCSTLPGSTFNSSTNQNKLNVLIEIDEDLLTSNSIFNIAKTILHESIHAYLILKTYECDSTASFGGYDNKDLCQTINSFYDNLTSGSDDCSENNRPQHEFMFDYMLPTFQSVFNEIGKENLTSQRSIDFIENTKLNLDNNPSTDWNWDEFYYYFMMQGLHNTDSFENEIENDSMKNDLYNAYRSQSTEFSKNCN